MSEVTLRISRETMDQAMVALAMRREDFRARADNTMLLPITRETYQEWADQADSAYRELIHASVYSGPSPETTDATAKYHAQDPLERHERDRISFQGERL